MTPVLTCHSVARRVRRAAAPLASPALAGGAAGRPGAGPGAATAASTPTRCSASRRWASRPAPRLAPGALRVEIEAGRLDPRLRLAPCERIEPYLPPGARAWGRSRIGLRCVQGSTPWNVYLPVTVKVFAPAWVAASALPPAAELQPEMLRKAEVDWAAMATPPLLDASQLVGRTWPGRCRPAPPCARST